MPIKKKIILSLLFSFFYFFIPFIYVKGGMEPKYIEVNASQKSLNIKQVKSVAMVKDNKPHKLVLVP